MKKLITTLIILLIAILGFFPAISGTQNNTALMQSSYPEGNVIIMIETTMGSIILQLYEDLTPITVQNFIDLIEINFFDGLVFHRVIDDFVIQAGGYDVNGSYKESPFDAIPLEIHPEARHIDGAIGMARTNDPNSATSQFYICDGPQEFLDDNYAVFGEVIDGIDVVRAIAAVETTRKHRMEDWPIEDVVITHVHYLSGKTWYVDADNIQGPWEGTQTHPYQYIQDAIDHAQDYNTIYINEGTYHESIDIYRPLQLLGESKEHTIIKTNEQSSYAITFINSDNTYISNVTIAGETGPHIGISINGSENQIQNCIITECVIGILLSRSHENIIYSNQVSYCAKGIYIEEGNQNIVLYNTLVENDLGLFSSYATKNQIEHNDFLQNTQQARFTKLGQIGFLAPNTWKQNYWQNHTASIKSIPGAMYIPYGLPLTLFIPWFEFDFSPNNQHNT